ncbi:ComEC/Rec2 family competence protein, partial [Patescibacteria group bacterium]|nr:ComEC/Rec2 family competence protein [Patescibacteria group bacterium]
MLSSLFWHLGAFLFGLLLSSFLNLPNFAWWPWLLLVFSLLLRKKKNYSLFFFLLTFFCLGLWRGQSMSVVNANLHKYFNQTKTWDFLVCTDPEPDWYRQITTLCPLAPSFSGDFNQEKVLANLPLYPQVRYGDKLQLQCRLEKAPIFPDFNYAAYLAAHGIGAICSWPQVIELDSAAEGKSFWRQLYQAKRWALQQINYGLPEPEAGLASALLLGYKKTLHKSEEENFQQAGLSHIVAISGGHISLFIE